MVLSLSCSNRHSHLTKTALKKKRTSANNRNSCDDIAGIGSGHDHRSGFEITSVLSSQAAMHWLRRSVATGLRVDHFFLCVSGPATVEPRWCFIVARALSKSKFAFGHLSDMHVNNLFMRSQSLTSLFQTIRISIRAQARRKPRMPLSTATARSGPYKCLILRGTWCNFLSSALRISDAIC